MGVSKSARRATVRNPPPTTNRKPSRRPPPPGPSDRPGSGTLDRVRQDPRWILLVLRGYLGFAFLYAGLSKVGGRSFLDRSAPGSLYATLLAVRARSPIGGLLGPVQAHPFAFGLLMAAGETAVGVGMLLGLWTQVAALGGMLISLSLFLTVSWSATPWYTGADLVYLFAFTPLLLGGAGPLSADAWLALRRGRDRGRGASDDVRRRVLVTGLAALGSLIALGAAALLRRGSSAHPSAAAGSTGAPPASGGTTTPTATGKVVLAASAVPVGAATRATDPSTGDPMYVLQLKPGVFTALDALCPHQGCTVSFLSASAGFECPCHLSTFDSSGAVTQGPASTGLPTIPVVKSGNDIIRT